MVQNAQGTIRRVKRCKRTMASVCVIIPAFDAEYTIARAVRSALAEPEVAEVVVVDDGSTDCTGAAARRAGDDSGRLSIVRFEKNRGPSAARNAAIAASTSPLLAILDADDYFIPGRFANLIDDGDWDLIADNVVFVPEAHSKAADIKALTTDSSRRRPLRFDEFVGRNISRRGQSRGELGFLKPIMRRTLLDRLALRYDESVRLGEDYILYATALSKGARFTIAERPGYVAIERQRSLSGRHRTADLASLLAADRRLERGIRTPSARRLVAAHARSIDRKHDHRQFLDVNAARGAAAAIRPFLGRPAALFALSAAVLRDKLKPLARSARPPAIRLLLGPQEFRS
ncbi:glycosyltransferase [Sphingomonas koreensis]|nr:glycosyltransferase [Sphingomonas koreensis]